MEQYKFLTEFYHNGRKYGCEIYAESKEEAENLKGEAEKENGSMRPYDPKTHLEYITLKKLEIKQDNEKLERELRKYNAIKAFCFAIWWAGFVALQLIIYIKYI